MVKCTNCIHYFVCKTLKRKMEDYFAEACVAYMNREDCVAVVRCKDCKYLEHGNRCSIPLGMGLGEDQGYIFVDATDFCSYGERREGE